MSRWFRRSSAPEAPAPPPPASTPPARGAAVAPRQAPRRPPRTGPLRAVVVDDDRPLAEHLRDLLVDLGIDVLSVATTGDQALAVARVLGPDVVLTDLRMPGMDGVELTRELCKLPAPPAVVMLSAYDDASLQDEAREAGAGAYLVKGSPGQEVLAALVSAAGSDPC